MHVMDENGDIITEKYYNNWNDFIVADMLAIVNSEYIGYTPRCSEDCKKTESKYENIHKLIELSGLFKSRLTEQEVIEILGTLKRVTMDDTYYLERKIENRIFTICHRDFKFIPSPIDEKKMDKSVMILTEGFEVDPIKGYVRFNHFHGRRYARSCANYYELSRVLNIYWIYLFDCEPIVFEKCVNLGLLDKIDPEKALEYYEQDNSITYYDIIIDAFRYRKEKYEKTIEQLKEQHQKEIEELLSPGGQGYLATKERFEKMQKENSNKDRLD